MSKIDTYQKKIYLKWEVRVTKKAQKQVNELPVIVQEQVRTLVLEIENKGPVRGNWPNYSKLNVTDHHCHVKKGRPTYVACWRVVDKIVQLVEVYYAGTHEKAPY